jgi:hypothetical protein
VPIYLSRGIPCLHGEMAMAEEENEEDGVEEEEEEES